jgi:poly-gamma-glutamate capsule biosynthesis protein CapA/YwtB (metallophosphatase superfamily)
MNPRLLGGVLLTFTVCAGALTMPFLPFRPEEPPMTETRVRIVAVGDIMFHDPQIDHAWNGTAFDFHDTFSDVRPIFEAADLAVGNFEAVTAGEQVGYHGFPCFNAPDTVMTALVDSGFDLFTTANNHCLDQGDEGIRRTLENIARHGARNVGTDSPETGIRPYALETVKGVRIAFLAYTYGVNENEWKVRVGKPAQWVHLIDRERMENDLAAAREAHPDFVVVFMHWGEEYAKNPSTEQLDLAEWLFALGVDVILGSHPHVLQRADSKTIDGKRKWVIYSMGNFVSNQRLETMDDARTEDGVIVTLEFVKTSQNKRLDSVEFTPTWVDKYSDSDRIRYRIVPLTGQETDDRPAASYRRTCATLGITSSR